MNLPSRRALLAAPFLLAATARAQEPSGWSRDRLMAAWTASGRPLPNLTPDAFAAIQARRVRGLQRLEQYLVARFGEADPAVLRAFAEVPREFYHHNYEAGFASPWDAWEDNAKPWGIGYGSALSDYLGQAYMTQVSAVKPDHVTLEIGTGSGFQSSVLSRMARRSYSIEIIEPLGKRVGPLFKALGYENVESRVGDGFFGWPEVEGGFDLIIVTCAAQYAPPALFQQLKPGGRLVIPIGQPFRRGQFLYVYTKDEEGKVHSRKDVGVFFIPMTGRMMQPGATPAGSPPA